MSITHILILLVQEVLLRGNFIAVEVPAETTCHAKVVHEKRMLVDMLKDAEFASIERESVPLFEVEMWVQPCLFVVFLLLHHVDGQFTGLNPLLED